MKTALITGSTDGIGKETALSLAKDGYQIHVIGRSVKKGEKVIRNLKEVNPEGKHRLFIFDLSDIKSNIDFLEQYKKEHDTLDFLMLNANPFPKKNERVGNGYDLIFMVGYISRYIFSVMLNEMLSNTEGSRVMHIGDVGSRDELRFDKMKNANHGLMKAISIPYTGSAYLAYYYNRLNITKVPHEYMGPGGVNTNQIKRASFLIRFLSKFAGTIEPSEMGDIVKNHLKNVTSDKCGGKFYYRNKEKEANKKLRNNEVKFKELMKFSEELTEIKW